jgi:hypothetical protein
MRNTRDPDFARRAAERRRTWAGGVARSAQEMALADLDFWLAASPAQRLEGLTALLTELHHLGGHDGPFPRLDRSVGGVRRWRS